MRSYGNGGNANSTHDGVDENQASRWREDSDSLFTHPLAYAKPLVDSRITTIHSLNTAHLKIVAGMAGKKEKSATFGLKRRGPPTQRARQRISDVFDQETKQE